MKNINMITRFYAIYQNVPWILKELQIQINVFNTLNLR